DAPAEHAAGAAVRTPGLRAALPCFVPRAGGAHVVLALEHQRAGGAHADAVAAVHARRIRQADVELGRDVRIESTTGDADRECVLGVDAARLHALVAEDAARVIPDIEVVVDLD